jgi:hypothetical protein
MDWNGRRSFAEVPGGCRIGRVVKVRSKAQTTLGISITKYGVLESTVLLHSPPRGVSGDVFAYCT